MSYLCKSDKIYERILSHLPCRSRVNQRDSSSSPPSPEHEPDEESKKEQADGFDLIAVDPKNCVSLDEKCPSVVSSDPAKCDNLGEVHDSNGNVPQDVKSDSQPEDLDNKDVDVNSVLLDDNEVTEIKELSDSQAEGEASVAGTALDTENSAENQILKEKDNLKGDEESTDGEPDQFIYDSE